MRRLTIDLAHRHAAKHGGKCLSPSYKNSKSPLQWECAKGHNWQAVLGSLRHSNSWCPKCSSLVLHNRLRTTRATTANVELHELAKKKGGVWLSGKFKGQKHKLVWRCANGHEWKAAPSMIRSGTWCPVCSTGRGERLARVACEHIFKDKFPRTKPSWLLNSRGRAMELDGYSDKLKVAFEHQGEQHYEHNFFNLSKGSLSQRRADDVTKVRLCKKHGVLLMLIPEVGSRLSENELERFIRAWASRRVPHLSTASSSVNYVSAYKDNSSVAALQRIQTAAELKGGRCLEAHYKGSKTLHRFECGNGHVWAAKPYQIKKGGWCFKCAVAARTTWRKPLEALQKTALARGGRLVSECSLGSKIKHEWECAKGHRWWAKPNAIQQGSWCTECRRWTLADMQAIARSKGGELLDTNFKAAKERLSWKCSKGHTWVAVGHRVANGTWCPTCAGHAKPTINDMKHLAESRGGLCLSDRYYNAYTKLTWQCGHGHKWKAIPSSVKSGSWCPKCFRERLGKIRRIKPIAELGKLAAKRGGKVVSTENMGSRVKHEWECARGHRWWAKPTLVQQGYWCTKCARALRKNTTI